MASLACHACYKHYGALDKTVVELGRLGIVDNVQFRMNAPLPNLRSVVGKFKNNEALYFNPETDSRESIAFHSVPTDEMLGYFTVSDQWEGTRIVCRLTSRVVSAGEGEYKESRAYVDLADGVWDKDLL